LTGAKYIKLLGLILGVAALNVVVLSPGLLGVKIGGSALETASGVALLVASALAVLYGSYVVLFKQPVIVPVKQLQTHEDYAEALAYYRRVRVLEEDISLALEQMERIRKKKETLLGVLGQRFDPNELSYKKFSSVVHEVEKLFYLNVRSVLNRLNAFDESEFKRLANRKSAPFSQKLLEEKANVYNDYLAFVKSSVGTNEEILLKLDKLLLEISRLDSLEPGDIDDMPCMQEIDSLIKQTKLYRQ